MMEPHSDDEMTAERCVRRRVVGLVSLRIETESPSWNPKTT